MAMTPMDAWSIISANLAHLVRLRRCNGDPKGFVDADTEAEVFAYKALREMQDRMYSKPMTFNQLIRNDGKPVWVNGENGGWGLVDSRNLVVVFTRGRSISVKYLEGRVFRYRPAEVKNDV